MKKRIIKREKQTLKRYFDLNKSCKTLKPDEHSLEELKKRGLEVHYLPRIDYREFPSGSLSNFYLKLAEESKLRESSLNLNSGWIAVEAAPKPKKKTVWLHKNAFFDFIDKLGGNSRSLCGISAANDFAGWDQLESRLGTSRKEVEACILEQIREEKGKKVRLPGYLEYVYLGEAFYSNWGRTKTWEWLQDKLKDNRSLAAGFKEAKKLGADPVNHWSTILGYRLLMEL